MARQETTGVFHSLQFADDALIFSGVGRQNIVSLKFILYSYELPIGLKINFEKSTVLGLGITDKHRDQVAAILGSKSGVERKISKFVLDHTQKEHHSS